MFEELFTFPIYRYFCTVTSKEEIEYLSNNPFLKPLDFIYCKEDNNYYVYEEKTNYSQYGEIESVHGEFRVISRGNQFGEQVRFFHRLNIGDTLKLKEDKSGTVIDVKYSMRLKDVTYVIKFDDTSTTEILGSIIDSQADKEYPPIQSLILKTDIPN